VEHPVDAVQQRLQDVHCEVGLDRPEARFVANRIDVRLLELARVVVGERIDTHDRVATIEQLFREVRADEARTAGDQVRPQVRDVFDAGRRAQTSRGRSAR